MTDNNKQYRSDSLRTSQGHYMCIQTIGDCGKAMLSTYADHVSVMVDLEVEDIPRIIHDLQECYEALTFTSPDEEE